ncbi:tRNA glutamyl-Q(34) synthetase GluQRS [Salinisphaera sp. T5B8]|uniref:tRNA glutamyl-Q(34) synthetase GluQRS n=1 Tax=Salinisphaera sp. T5B8 TaxID=1304154 RepID=UPI003341B1C7
MTSGVVGRFAPSPSGALHMGSLVAALGSFLQARAQGGAWLLRIDDLDTPRVQPWAITRIIDALEFFGLRWDGPIVYQDERRTAYARAIDHLKHSGRAFDCGCTRREARSGTVGIEGPIYPGTCRNGLPAGRSPRSVRLRVDACPIEVCDAVQGVYTQQLDRDIGDFVIRRADGIVAYQLATVVDDAYQGVTEVVRGADLLSSTPRQIALQQALGLDTPRYAHLPVITDANGDKLGKSTGAIALQPTKPAAQLCACLQWLGQAPPNTLYDADIARVLHWACDNWALAQVPRVAEITRR